MGRFDHNRYVEMTMHFKCNLRCEHCMILDTMHRLQPEPMERFEALLQHNRATGQYKGLILTGAEITLRRDLPDLARAARAARFEHVRIQTHGMRLADMDYCRGLIEAGIDEFFVSVTAADPATHDAITAVPGSFARTMRGLENLEAFPHIVSMTNTVITQRSFRQLPEIVQRLAHLRRLARMDFWNYWPMGEADDKELIANHLEVLPFLKRALADARALGREVEVKNFPECLLRDDATALLNDQPKLFIDPSFWPEFMRNGFEQCIHRAACGSTRCLGLNTAYIRRFGWHEKELTPLPSAAGRGRSLPVIR